MEKRPDSLVVTRSLLVKRLITKTMRFLSHDYVRIGLKTARATARERNELLVACLNSLR